MAAMYKLSIRSREVDKLVFDPPSANIRVWKPLLLVADVNKLIISHEWLESGSQDLYLELNHPVQ